MTEIAKEIVDNIKKGYITAFFDAEGSIGIDKYYVLRVIINQAYKPVLEKIDKEFKTVSGIKVHSKEGYDKRGVHHKGAWCWRLNSNDAISFLEYIYTYSIEKRHQIKLGIEYQKTIMSYSSHGHKLSQTEFEQRDWFKNEIKRIKNEIPTEQEVRNYDNEIKKMSIPKDIRDGKQKTMFDTLDDLYKALGINTTNSEQITNNQNVLKMTNYIEMGYLAGFMDGEGYIGICKTEGNSYGLHVTISNTNFDMLKIYENKFGGKIRKVQKDAEHHKEKYHWDINYSQALPFLKYIQPFMIVKSKQVNLAIEFQEWHDQIRIIKSSEQRKRAEWYYNTIMDMKKETGEDTQITLIEEEPTENPNTIQWKDI